MAAERTRPRTLFEKTWDAHKVVERDDGQTLLYVDRHYIHDGSRRAFEVLAENREAPSRRVELALGAAVQLAVGG